MYQMVLSVTDTRKKRDSWVRIVRYWWLLNRVWLLRRTPKTFNDSADKSGIYSRKRAQWRKSIKARLGIITGDRLVARGLEKSGLGLYCPPSVRAVAGMHSCFPIRSHRCVHGTPGNQEPPNGVLAWSFFLLCQLCMHISAV